MTKRERTLFIPLFLLSLIIGGILIMAADTPEEKSTAKPTKLAVVWTEADREVATNMVMMYALNAKRRGWWDDVTLIVWGPSQKLLAQDDDLQKRLREMKELGVKVEACKACADDYGLTDELEAFGLTVDYMGVPLTNYLKSPDWEVVTF